jgi:hypothetical protein
MPVPPKKSNTGCGYNIRGKIKYKTIYNLSKTEFLKRQE